MPKDPDARDQPIRNPGQQTLRSAVALSVFVVIAAIASAIVIGPLVLVALALFLPAAGAFVRQVISGRPEVEGGR